MPKYSKADSSRSGIHRRVEDVLDGMSLSYESEVYFPPYHVDIYMREWHLAIEADGPFHNRRKDEGRDALLLEKFGLIVIRLDMTSYLTKAEIADPIVRAIEEHYATVDKRRLIWRTMHLRG